MTDKQIIIDENEINPNYWLEPYKPIPACEIKDCDHLVYAGDDVYGCRIAEDGLVCDDFNNDDECCMYRQLEYYKEALKAKEQECKELKNWKETVVELFERTCCCKYLNEENNHCGFYNRKCIGRLNQCLYRNQQTLTEIKEIAENVIKNVSDRCIETTPMYGVHKQILQKISKCEVTNEQS